MKRQYTRCRACNRMCDGSNRPPGWLEDADGFWWCPEHASIESVAKNIGEIIENMDPQVLEKMILDGMSPDEPR